MRWPHFRVIRKNRVRYEQSQSQSRVLSKSVRATPLSSEESGGRALLLQQTLCVERLLRRPVSQWPQPCVCFREHRVLASYSYFSEWIDFVVCVFLCTFLLCLFGSATLPFVHRLKGKGQNALRLWLLYGAVCRICSNLSLVLMGWLLQTITDVCTGAAGHCCRWQWEWKKGRRHRGTWRKETAGVIAIQRHVGLILDQT